MARSPAAAPSAQEAARQLVLLGSRDILLTELLGLLTEQQREVLLQAAVSRIPMSVSDLAFAVRDEAPSPDTQRAVEETADRLLDLTLLSPADGEIVVQTWVGEALAEHQGDAVAVTTRHNRAAAMRLHRLQEGRAGFDDLTEVARHYAVASRFDELANFASAAAESLPGELLVASFLGEVLPTFPRDHDSFLILMYRESLALTSTGNAVAAHQRAQELLDVTRARVEADPTNVSLQRDLSISLNRLADLAAAAGQVDTASQLYQQSLTITRRLAEADPANLAYQYVLSVTLNSLADLTADAGEVNTANRLYQQSLTITRRLAEADPANPAYQQAVAVSLDRQANLAAVAGQVDTAIQLYQQSLTITQRRSDADPANVDYPRDLSLTMSKLADLAAAIGQVDTAKGLYELSLAISRRLTEADPTNVSFQRDLSDSYERLGDMARDAGETAQARDLYQLALTIADRLYQVDRTNMTCREDIARYRHRLDSLS